MTIREIKERIKAIEEAQKEDIYEGGHRAEDDLYLRFIEYVATGKGKNLKKKAKLILSTKDLPFERFYA